MGLSVNEEEKALLSSPIPSECGDIALPVATYDRPRKKRRTAVYACAAGLTLVVLAGAAAGTTQTSAGQRSLEYAGAQLQGIKEWWSSVSGGRESARPPSYNGEESNEEMIDDSGLEAQEQEEDLAEVDGSGEWSEAVDTQYSFIDEIAPDGYIDTQPPFPPSLIHDHSPESRYLSYLPHSGFHNQRSELENALMLSYLLNRTLITPFARLGSWPQTWKQFDTLEHSLDQAQKTEGERPLVDVCREEIPAMEAAKEKHATFKGSSRCKHYLDYTEISWPLMTDFSILSATHSILPRADITSNFFTKSVSEGGLGLLRSEVHRLEGANDRYGYQFYDSSNTPSEEGKYSLRYNTDDLKLPPFSDYKVLELGTMFGASRMRVRSEANRPQLATIASAMVFRNKMLDSIAHQIVHRLGGVDSFLGVHLRIGDGFFERNAVENMKDVFTRVCTGVFGLTSERAESIHESNRGLRPDKRRMVKRSRSDDSPSVLVERSHYDVTDGMRLEDFGESSDVHLRKRQALEMYTSRQDMPLHESLTCRGKLHTASDMLPFNRPIYVATDSHRPLEDQNLAVFFNTFPCAFLLADFAEPTPASSEPISDLIKLASIRSEQDGIQLGHFMYPFLEAMVVARSKIGTFGTRMSTFSSFATTTLHNAYLDEADQ